MAMKLPRATIEELDRLAEDLGKPDASVRDAALMRLTDYERTGRLPLDALLALSKSENPSLSMYAISALGRNGSSRAVKQLAGLAERNREGNQLFFEQIVDALGETQGAGAVPVLLALLGLRGSGWGAKLFGRRAKREDEAAQAQWRETMVLPVLRALAKIGDAKSAPLVGDYLEHADPLVRWHAIQILVKGNVNDFNGRLKEMATGDPHELVKEAAALAIDRLEPLPPNLNN